ncbi:DUF29 domain-containing protein [Niveispirillum sp. BGYR6]|uniref:DUF29 domain-containing protein n=1 Tax=Niveispirillum sp. BGYR6 TaxID=2971249 RepID=UPI0022B96FCA|nr:DUF29 domain-containing protein [Niveispirillum sp. BGYR6]MDG5495480.1 DUF29 domain-containing protein [Niveispirillum sp. BGYR6]
MSGNLYETDFYAWAMEQAALLRAGKLSAADIDNIAEEIESMGKTEKRELISRLKVLLMHLLKWQFQPAGRCVSWQLTIKEQRREVADHLSDNPSLKSRLPDSMANAYAVAIIAAARETSIAEETFPAECPWSFEQIMDGAFWPDQH